MRNGSYADDDGTISGPEMVEAFRFMDLDVDEEQEQIFLETGRSSKSGEIDFETFVHLLTTTFWETYGTKPSIKSELKLAATDPFTVLASAFRRR